MRKAIVTRSNRPVLIVKYKSPNNKIKPELENMHVNTSYYINVDVMQQNEMKKNQKLY